MAYFPHLRKPTHPIWSFIYMHIEYRLPASDCTFEQIWWDPHMHVNEAPWARAWLQRGQEEAFLETCYRDNLKPDTTIRNFFFLAHVCARRTPRNLVFQAEVIYLNVDLFEKWEGIQGLILILLTERKECLCHNSVSVKIKKCRDYCLKTRQNN